MRTPFPDLADAWTEEDARVVLDEWRQSGDTIAAFARKRGITPPRLYWWKKKLASGARPTTLSLVPAMIVSGSGATVTIRLPGEVAIEVANASPNWVAAIVAELTRTLA